MNQEAWDLCEFRVKPSVHDARDIRYTAAKIEVRPTVDLREWASRVEDQGYLGSCVGNAITDCYEIQINRLYPAEFEELSRLFVYYNSRVFTGTTDIDAGTTIRDGLRGLKQYGVCCETLWPYTIANFATEPSAEAYADAIKRIIPKYEKTSGNTDIMEVVNNDKPVVLGILVFSDFLLVDKDNPVVPMPKDSDIDVSGHAVSVVGYNLNDRQFLIKNSYGKSWGDNGYGWLPFEYVDMYSFENWYFDIPDLTSTMLIDQR